MFVFHEGQICYGFTPCLWYDWVLQNGPFSSTVMKSSLVKLPSPRLGQLGLWSLSEPAPSACSELSCFHFWWREPTEWHSKHNTSQTCKKIKIHLNLNVNPHLIRMRVHHLLADPMQLCGVTNKTQVLLLDDLRGCLAGWPPHLLEHLKAGRNHKDAGENQNTNKHLLGVLLSDSQRGIIAWSVQLTDLLGNRRGDVSRFLEFQQLSQGRRRDWAEIKWKGDLHSLI